MATAFVDVDRNIHNIQIRPYHSIPAEENECLMATLKRVLSGTLRQSPGEAGTEPPADSQPNRQELLRPQRLHTLSEVRQAVLRQRQPQQRAQVPAVPKKL